MRLVADIGGTNSRLALSDSGQIRPGTTRSFRNADFASFEAVAQSYMGDLNTTGVQEVLLAVAGPVDGDRAQLTNRGWVISAKALAKKLGATRAQIINDLVALGYAVPSLGPDALDLISAGHAEPGPSRQSLVVGIGTGFNVSPVVQSGPEILCLRSEIGHAGLPAGVIRVIEARQPGLSSQFDTVEHCFSGRGFAQICTAITGLTDHAPEAFIQLHDQANDQPVAEALAFYGELMGWLMRDLMLAYLPTCGIYFAGSVARSVLARPGLGPFQRVVAQSHDINTHDATPIYAINADTAALIGCATAPMH